MITLELIAQAIKEASKAEQELTAFDKQAEALRPKLVEGLKVATAKACDLCFQGSVQGLTKASMAKASGMSETAIGRYVTAGNVIANLQDEDGLCPIEYGQVIQDVAKGYINQKTAKDAETVSAYRKAVAQGKGKGKDAPKAPEQVIADKIADSLKPVIKGKITLEVWQGILAEQLAKLQG